MKTVNVLFISLVILLLQLKVNAQCDDPQALRKFNDVTEKMEDAWTWSDPNVVYWGTYVQSFGLDIHYFNMFSLPWYLTGYLNELEVEAQTIDCINQWDYWGCIELSYNDNSPSVVLEFLDDDNLFPLGTQYGATANAIIESFGEYEFVYYSPSSPTGFAQTSIYLNKSSSFEYEWSLALENPGVDYAPFKPILLHELGHLIGLGHISNTDRSYVMSLGGPHNQFLFLLTFCDKDGLASLCDFFGTPVGIEDAINIESGPSSFSPSNNVTYSARFYDIPPSSYMYNWNWEINLFHGEGTYSYVSGSTTGWNYTEWSFTAPSLPTGYCWFRDDNNNVIGVVKVSGTDSDGHYQEDIQEVALQNIPNNTTSGALTSNETWCGNMNITGNLTVPADITLEILPSCNIYFENNTSLTVYGTLTAVGIPFSKINFLRREETGSWATITFNGSASSNSILDYVVVEYGAGIRCINGADVIISSSTIDHCTEGIYFYNSQPQILNNSIIEPVHNGINGDASGMSVEILHNTITKTSSNPTYRNYQGIILANFTNGYISHNDISGFYWGMYIGGGSDAYFTNDSYYTNNPNNRVRYNLFGICAGWGGYIVGSLFKPAYGYYNSIYDNANYDAFAYNSSQISACYNWWGEDGAQAYEDGTSSVMYCYPLTSDPWESLKQGNGMLSSNLASNYIGDDPPGYDTNDVFVGLSLEMEGKINEAILHYKQMITRNSIPGFALGRLAGIKKKHSIPNIRGYLDSLTVGEKSYKPIVLTVLAGVYMDEDDYTKAMSLYNKIIRKYPDTYYSVNALFEKFFAALNYAKDLELAGQALSELQALGSTDEEYLMRLQIAENLYTGSGSKSLGKTQVTNTENEDNNLPAEYSLLGNYPNPFNPATNISYAVPYQSSIELTIYDIMGREIKSFHISSQPSGYQSIYWDGMDNNGNSISSGVYLYRFKAKSLENNEVFVKTSKLMLLK
jgi:tetratricopeptide (TPR) repeat protein